MDIFFACILIFSANNFEKLSRTKYKLLVYFSFICKTPTKVNKPKAITGDQTANIKGSDRFVLTLKTGL